MKIAYFDCFSGASGDMILGSLIDAGFQIEELRNELKKLNLSGYEIRSTQKTKNGIAGTKFDVDIPHTHYHRSLKDIFEIIDDSALQQRARNPHRP